MADDKKKTKTATRTEIIRAAAPARPIIVQQQAQPPVKSTRGSAVARKVKQAAEQTKAELIGAGAAALLGFAEAKGYTPNGVNLGLVGGGIAVALGHMSKNDTVKAVGGGLLAAGAYEFARNRFAGAAVKGELDGDLQGELDGDLY